MSLTTSQPTPLARIGVISDVQYADKDDGSFEGSIFRFREVCLSYHQR